MTEPSEGDLTPEMQALQVSEDALCLQIGRAARSHVALDLGLRQVHHALLSPSAGTHLTPQIMSTEALARDCTIMLEATRFREDAKEAALSAIAAASAVNVKRNRVVHDMWMREPIDDAMPPRWYPYRLARPPKRPDPPRDLQYVEDVVKEIDFARTRLHGLVWVLTKVLSYGPQSAPEPLPGVPSLEMWIAVTAGKFDLMTGGAFKVHGYNGWTHADWT